MFFACQCTPSGQPGSTRQDGNGTPHARGTLSSSDLKSLCQGLKGSNAPLSQAQLARADVHLQIGKYTVSALAAAMFKFTVP